MKYKYNGKQYITLPTSDLSQVFKNLGNTYKDSLHFASYLINAESRGNDNISAQYVYELSKDEVQAGDYYIVFTVKGMPLLYKCIERKDDRVYYGELTSDSLQYTIKVSRTNNPRLQLPLLDGPFLEGFVSEYDWVDEWFSEDKAFTIKHEETDESSNISISYDANGKLMWYFGNYSKRRKHIYILSDEEIKEGDWCYVVNEAYPTGLGNLIKCESVRDGHVVTPEGWSRVISMPQTGKELMKIIASNNNSIDVPRISNTWLKSYVDLMNEQVAELTFDDGYNEGYAKGHSVGYNSGVEVQPKVWRERMMYWGVIVVLAYIIFAIK